MVITLDQQIDQQLIVRSLKSQIIKFNAQRYNLNWDFLNWDFSIKIESKRFASRFYDQRDNLPISIVRSSFLESDIPGNFFYHISGAASILLNVTNNTELEIKGETRKQLRNTFVKPVEKFLTNFYHFHFHLLTFENKNFK